MAAVAKQATEQATPSERLRLCAPTDPVDRYRAVLEPRECTALEAWVSTFYQFQHDWLFEQARLAICNKSRQIGTSHTTAAVAVLWGAFHGELTTIISIGDRESIEVLDKCKRHAMVLQKLGSTMANTVRSNTNEIVFHSGGRILALPSSGGRSFSGNVFLDEFAYQEHAARVWDAAAPVTLLGHKMRVVSTPNGVGNEFHQLWERANKQTANGDALSTWTPHLIPLSRALAQGYPVDIDHCWELAKGDPRLFEQMFNCSFLDNVLQYIPGELIAECCTDDVLTAVPSAGGEYFAGLDIGRTNDLTCLVVLLKVNRMRYLVHVETMKRTDSDGLEDMVARAFNKYKLRRLCIDATGLGSFPAERIKKLHSEKIDVPHRRPKVEPIDFTPSSKEALATGLYSAMTDGTVRLPASDAALPSFASGPNVANQAGVAAQLRREIASLRRVITTSANVRYETPHTSEGHGDRAWALMLALHACSTPNAMVEALKQRVQMGSFLRR